MMRIDYPTGSRNDDVTILAGLPERRLPVYCGCEEWEYSEQNVLDQWQDCF